MSRQKSTIRFRSKPYEALGNLNRLSIAEYLADRKDANVTQIIEGIGGHMSQPAISQHLAKMRKAGIVEFEKNKRWVYYRLTPLARKLLNVTK